MFAIINESFNVMFNNDKSDCHYFNKGDKVEILKIVEDESFEGGKAYVVYSSETNASYTVAECWIRIYI